VIVSQIRTVPSSPAVASQPLSGAIAIANPRSVWPVRGVALVPVKPSRGSTPRLRAEGGARLVELKFVWPAISVAGAIRCVQTFTPRLVQTFRPDPKRSPGGGFAMSSRSFG
jgi:hypothetical protein